MADLHISWEEYNKKTEQLASMVYKDGWEFNQVVCIAKGGMRVGDIMARIFDVPLAVLSVESYRGEGVKNKSCLLYTSPSPRDKRQSRMPSSA